MITNEAHIGFLNSQIQIMDEEIRKTERYLKLLKSNRNSFADEYFKLCADSIRDDYKI